MHLHQSSTALATVSGGPPADRLVDAPDLTLSGPVLTGLLTDLDLAPIAAPVAHDMAPTPSSGGAVRR